MFSIVTQSLVQGLVYWPTTRTKLMTTDVTVMNNSFTTVLKSVEIMLNEISSLQSAIEFYYCFTSYSNVHQSPSGCRKNVLSLLQTSVVMNCNNALVANVS